MPLHAAFAKLQQRGERCSATRAVGTGAHARAGGRGAPGARRYGHPGVLDGQRKESPCMISPGLACHF